jgi:hypothetical protein
MKNQNGWVDSSLHEALFRSMDAPPLAVLERNSTRNENTGI